MIEIDGPPDIRACASCSRPLVWLWSYRLAAAVAFVTDPASTRTLHVHECERHGMPPPTWRQLELVPPSTRHAGAERVRQELEKRSNEKGTPREEEAHRRRRAAVGPARHHGVGV